MAQVVGADMPGTDRNKVEQLGWLGRFYASVSVDHMNIFAGKIEKLRSEISSYLSFLLVIDPVADCHADLVCSLGDLASWAFVMTILLTARLYRLLPLCMLLVLYIRKLLPDTGNMGIPPQEPSGTVSTVASRCRIRRKAKIQAVNLTRLSPITIASCMVSSPGRNVPIKSLRGSRQSSTLRTLGFTFCTSATPRLL